MPATQCGEEIITCVSVELERAEPVITLEAQIFEA
jgi:hypothetical protein